MSEPTEGAATDTHLDSLVESYLFRLPKSFTYQNYIFPGIIMSPDRFDQIKTMNFRPNDILIASYPKSGTTWVSEIVSLLVNDGNLDYVKSLPLHERVPWLDLDTRFFWVRVFAWWQGLTNISTALEDMLYSRNSNLSEDSPPRVFFTHLPLQMLPTDALTGGCKIIYVSRNPKDTAVSFYHFHQMARYLGQQANMPWDEFLDLFLEGEIYSGSWFDHNLAFWSFQAKASNVLFVKYENMKMNLAKEVQRIAHFLGIEQTESELETIVDHCSFENMKTNKMVNREDVWLFNQKISRFMRKGTIGDWKNRFTVAENEKFDDIYINRMAYSGLDYVYELA
jgi:hypothetical protein